MPEASAGSTEETEGQSPAQQPLSITESYDAHEAAAAGIRSTSNWIAAAFGAVPSSAVLALVLKGAGDTGFDAAFLVPGIFLAAAGAAIGILAFARVQEPVGLSEDELTNSDLAAIPETPERDIRLLRQMLNSFAAEVADLELKRSRQASKAARLRALAAAAKQDASKADQAAEKQKDDPDGPWLAQAARNLHLQADEAQHRADEAAADVEETSPRIDFYQDQAARRYLVLARALRARAATEVSKRFRAARLWAGVATAFVAAGVALVALAPAGKPTEATTLVRLEINDAGKQAIGCPDSQLQGIRLQADEKSVEVATFPTASCPPRVLTFPTFELSSVGPYGQVSKLEAIKLKRP